jgi:predicted Ser/Thr protein kinase
MSSGLGGDADLPRDLPSESRRAGGASPLSSAEPLPAESETIRAEIHEDRSMPDTIITGLDELEMVLVSTSGNGAGAEDKVPLGSTVIGAAGTLVLPDPSRPEARWALPRDFGKFELLEEIGRGGMGVVFRARQKDLDRIVAIKMILSSHLASAEQVERFYAEARAAARVQHGHIVSIHEVGQFRGQHYFAMEYVAGPSLAKLLKNGPLAPEIAARYVMIVARAVDHLHAQGIAHRDLKPSNILLDPSDQPYVTDFGLAKMLTADGAITHSGVILGTPNYMAPEQAAGRGERIGPRSDVYSLGTILFELLTGRPPFEESGPLETLVQVIEGEPPRPTRLRPGLPKALEWICLKCLEKDPANRYASAGALAQDLDHFLRGEHVEARRSGLWQLLRRWARREPALASRLGTMAICGAIIQANYYLVGNLAPAIHRESIAVVVAWAVVSLVCQWILQSPPWAQFGRVLWALADVGLFTVLVAINHGLTTALVAGYFPLVVASGLWFRESLVWITTGLAVGAYGFLVLFETWHQRLGSDSPYRHFVFAAVLAVAGLITSYQVKRVRALSRYYEHRPLP